MPGLQRISMERMAALYPTLEDLVIDQYQSAQREKDGNANVFPNLNYTPTTTPPYNAQATEFPKLPTAPIYESSTVGYPPPNYETLGRAETSASGRTYPVVPPYFSYQQAPAEKAVAIQSPQAVETISSNAVSQIVGNEQVVLGSTVMVAPLTSQSCGLQKANVTHGVRQVIMIKNKKKDKYGLRFRSVNKGIFVQFVAKDSPAAAVGIRFGDQILKVNETEVVGMDGGKVLDLMTKPKNIEQIVLTIRDRPFERTITLHKDSAGMFGFGHKENLVTAITKDSSASRNGLLTNHRILEIDGRSIIGFSTKEVKQCLREAPQTSTFTLIPTETYDELVKKLGSSMMKKQDHSIPEI